METSRSRYVVLAITLFVGAVVASFGIPVAHWYLTREANSDRDAPPGEEADDSPRSVRVGDQVITGDVTILQWQDVYESGDLEKAWAIAVDHGDLGQVQTLLRDGVDPDSRLRPGRTALIKSAWLGYTDLVRVLLAAGADPMAREEDTLGREGFQGETALHRAAFKGHLEIMQMLLDAGVPIDVEAGQPGYLRTPLAFAVTDFDAFTFLLDRGADLEAAGDPGSLLSSAAYERSLGVARYLLDAGAPVEGDPSRAEYGYTALWSAITGPFDRGREEMVRLLLEHGADPERAMNGGKTLLDLAREEGQTGVVALMERAVRGESLDLPVEAHP